MATTDQAINATRGELVRELKLQLMAEHGGRRWTFGHLDYHYGFSVTAASRGTPSVVVHVRADLGVVVRRYGEFMEEWPAWPATAPDWLEAACRRVEELMKWPYGEIPG